MRAFRAGLTSAIVILCPLLGGLTAQEKAEPPGEAASPAAQAPRVASPDPAPPETPGEPATSAAEPHASGFLNPEPAFRPSAKGFAFVYIREGVNFAAYDKVLLEPVVFFLKDDAKYKGIHADELKKLSDAFNKSVARTLGEAYPLVSEPGPGVLRVRTAITELVPNKPELSVAMAIIPGGSLAYAVLPEKYNNIGAASLEAEVLDSVTGERLAAALDRHAGKKTDLFKGMETWGHVEKAFAYWGAQFRSWLDEAHQKEPQGGVGSQPEATPRH